MHNDVMMYIDVQAHIGFIYQSYSSFKRVFQKIKNQIYYDLSFKITLKLG